MKPLSPREQLFVAEYLIDLNGAAAARRAGYAAASSRGTATRLRSRPRVARAIAAGLDAKARAAGVSAQSVVAGLARIGFADVRRFFDADGKVLAMTDLGEDVAACVSQLEVITKPAKKGEAEGETHLKIRICDRRQALLDLGKHLGMFTAPGKGKAVVEPEAPVVDQAHTAARIAAILEAARARRDGGG